MTRSLVHPRWIVAALLFLSTVINYLDRQNLSILARTIQDELHISDTQYGTIVQAFLLAYAITYFFAGRITDRLGTRLSMSLFIGWWSVATMCTSMARSAFSLGMWRFLLGVGEPGNYTAAPKAVSEWFPPRERGFVIGLYTAGATLGATIAPPLISWLATSYGWRAVFVITGSLGLIWLVPWVLIYRTPPSAEDRTPPPALEAYRTALSHKATWLLMIGRLITDPVWYFYLFWFPKYLTDSRHLPLLDLGRIAWMVYLAADIGSIAGGWLSGVFIKRGVPVVPARLRVMAIAACLLPLSPFVPFMPSATAAVLIASIAALAHLAWQVTLSSIVVDIFPQRLVGTVFGIVAAGSGLGGMLSTGIVARVVSEVSYTPLFIAMGFLHPLAFWLVWRLRRQPAAQADVLP